MLGDSLTGHAQQEAGLAALRMFLHCLTGSLWICMPRSLARLKILGRNFLLGVFIDGHAMTKCGRSSGEALHRGHAWSILFWLNLTLFAWRIYEPEISFALKLAATLFLAEKLSLRQRW